MIKVAGRLLPAEKIPGADAPGPKKRLQSLLSRGYAHAPAWTSGSKNNDKGKSVKGTSVKTNRPSSPSENRGR